MAKARITWVTFTMFLSAMTAQGAIAQAQEAKSQRPSLTLQAAIEAGNWLASVAIETEHGMAWPVAPEDGPDVNRALYSGTPGVILFMIELHRATRDARWLDLASRAGDDLIAWMQANRNQHAAGLWTGLGGQMFALHQLHLATHEDTYLAASKRAAEQIIASAKMLDDDPLTALWNGSTDVISGTAGIGLALLYAGEHLEVDGAMAVAQRAGETLVRQAVHVELDGALPGKKWAMSEDSSRFMPNFSHGTAGNAYFLVRLHQALPGSPQKFLNAARAGARYLLSIADTTDGRCLIFHHEPAGEQLFYLSWCHGPVGTSRLFHALAQATGDSAWSEWVDRGVKGIVDMGAPHHRSAGYWNNVGQCCGSAGIGGFVVDLWHRQGLDETTLRQLRPLAQVCAADAMRRGQRVAISGGLAGIKWTHAEHRVRPEHVLAQTGYMQGAAGIGMFLLDLHFGESGEQATMRFPDEPEWR